MQAAERRVTAVGGAEIIVIALRRRARLTHPLCVADIEHGAEAPILTAGAIQWRMLTPRHGLTKVECAVIQVIAITGDALALTRRARVLICAVIAVITWPQMRRV